jgi:predicted ester cyclase
LIHPTAMPCEAAYHGASGARAWLEAQWSAFPDLTLTDLHSVACGDIVAVRWTARATSKGPFLGVTPTGDMVEFTGVSMYRIEDGSVAEIWDTRNTLGILHQLDPHLGTHGHHH